MGQESPGTCPGLPGSEGPEPKLTPSMFCPQIPFLGGDDCMGGISLGLALPGKVPPPVKGNGNDQERETILCYV